MVTKRSIAGLGTIVLLPIVVAAVLPAVRRFNEQAGRRNIERRDRDSTEEELAWVRAGKRFDLTIFGAASLEAVVVPADCIAKVKEVHIPGWTDLADPRWSLLNRLPNLEGLSIYDSRGAEDLFKNIQGLKTIQRIFLESVPFSDTGMRYLAIPPNLRELVVAGGGGVTDAGLAHLRGHPALESVSFTNTAITDAGLAALNDIPRLRSAVLVDDKYGGASLTEAALRHLRGLTGLRTLTLGGKWVSQAGLRDLRMALPNCTIESKPGSEKRSGTEDNLFSG